MEVGLGNEATSTPPQKIPSCALQFFSSHILTPPLTLFSMTGSSFGSVSFVSSA